MPARHLLFVFLALAGCATSLRDREWLHEELRARVGAGTTHEQGDTLPPGVRLEDGVDEHEVASIALWRSPLLRAELTRIDAARATLAEARRPANPQVSVMGRIGPVTAVASLLVPIESLWQMPRRAEAAAREADATAEAVLMRALDIVRDVRLLHVALGLAVDRAALRVELAAVNTELARIAAVRSRVGDIGPLDERVTAADALVAEDASDLAATEVSLAEARLLAQLALEQDATRPLQATFSPDEFETPALPELLRIARAARPDARAAELALSAATARAGWERSRVVSLSLQADAFWGQPAGPGLRLGGRTELPLFGANPGGRGRAEAEIARMAALQEVTARSIVLEVTNARARVVQATRSREAFEQRVLPALEVALSVATQSFETGDESYVVALDALRRIADARLRLAELVAEARSAQCELERAMGARLELASRVAARNAASQGTP